MTSTFVVVGAGLAGARAAATLREEGFDGRVVLVGAEAERPYERPPLSKDYLRGEADRSVIYVHEDPNYYAEHDIELRTGQAVTAIDPGTGEVEVDGGERLAYDKLLLAPGAEPRRLRVPGADLDGIHYLRTVDDSDALRARIEAGGTVVVVGAGWIGAEVAASARSKGCDVTVVEPLSVPLERVLGPELGAFYRDVHTEHGVRMLLGAGVEAFEGDGGVRRVRTSDGQVLECDWVVAGIGVQPRVALAERAGAAIGDGILVDAHLQTSVPGVFAAGDVASVEHPFFGSRVRVEHWETALEQGPAAARAMLGSATPYDRIPYFYSDQYDVGMEYAGWAPEWDRVVFRGDPASREFIAFWLRDDRVIAGMNVNVWDVTDTIQRLIRSRQPTDLAQLTDPDVPLDELAPAPAS
jgi:3-phenylpropionate/trans-cinnamate dioxygenase ferredoxin reductase component